MILQGVFAVAALRVLFIGNSLTAANDLPAMVESMARAAGERTLEWKAVLQPGASLEDQWQAGDAVRAIRSQRWDVVVLQQGPSSQPDSRVLLRRDTARFSKEIRAAGARPALYMVWPARNRPGDFDGVSVSYRAAAKDVDGLIIPAGDVWREVWKRDRNAELYGGDGFHPSAEGSYVAALVMYRQLFGKSPLGLPSRITDSAGRTLADFPLARARLLQEAAAAATRK